MGHLLYWPLKPCKEGLLCVPLLTTIGQMVKSEQAASIVASWIWTSIPSCSSSCSGEKAVSFRKAFDIT